MKFSQGTPEQQANMRAYREYAKQKFTQEYPVALKFAAHIELHEALIRKHWGRQDAKTLMDYLVDASWDFYSPHTFIDEYTQKALDSIAKGMTFEELKAGGLFEREGSLFPVDNIPEANKPIHELMAFDDEQKAKNPVPFKDRIKQMQKSVSFGQRSVN